MAMTAELAFDDFETLADRVAREFKSATAEAAGNSSGSSSNGGGPADKLRSPSPSSQTHSGAMAGLRTLAQGWLSPGGTRNNGSPAAAGPLSPGGIRRMRSLSSAGMNEPIGLKRVTATIECDLASSWQLLPTASVKVMGTDGELQLDNFLLPHVMHRLSVKSKVLGSSSTEHCYGEHGASTSECQLEAFAEEVKYKVRCCQDRHDPTKTMHVVDQIYAAAGIPVRGGATDVPHLLARIEALDPRLLTPPVSRSEEHRRVGSDANESQDTPSRPSAPFIRSRTRPELGRDLKLRPAPGATVSPPSPSSATPRAGAPLAAVGSPARPPLQRSTSVVVS